MAAIEMQIKKTKISLLLMAFFALQISFTSTAHSETGQNKDQQLAEKLFSTYLAKHKNVQVDTARLILAPAQSKTTPALLVRFASPQTCRNNACMTTILMPENGNWKVVLEKHAKEIRIQKKVGPNGLYNLDIDGEVWEWTGGPTFYPKVSSLGEDFDATKTKAPNRIARAMEKILTSPEWLKIHHYSHNDNFNFNGTRIFPNNNASVWFVYAYAGGECSLSGCPSAVILDAPSGQKPLWVGLSDGSGSVSKSSLKQNGWSDILIIRRLGFDTLSYNGQYYKLSGTSYPSKITPAP